MGEYETKFKMYNVSTSGFISLEELEGRKLFLRPRLPRFQKEVSSRMKSKKNKKRNEDRRKRRKTDKMPSERELPCLGKGLNTSSSNMFKWQPRKKHNKTFLCCTFISIFY